jgi:hypothetical protein
MAAGLVSSALAAGQAKKAGEAANAEYNEKKGFLDNWFNKQYYSDITRRTDVQNMLRLMNENQEKQAKRDDAIAAVTGATPEAQLAAQDSRNKSYADALADIASNASQLKDTYLQQYQAQRLGLVNPQQSIYQNKANMWSQAGSNLFGTGVQMFGSGMEGLGKQPKTPKPVV